MTLEEMRLICVVYISALSCILGPLSGQKEGCSFMDFPYICNFIFVLCFGLGNVVHLRLG